MLKKTITFTDYNGVSRTEDFYFNLSQAEVVELESSVNGGLIETINRVVAAHDGKQIIDIFKKFILAAYGVKSIDGRKFIKNDELRTDFEQTEAYSILFMELATDATAAAAFVRGIIPNDTVSKSKELTNQEKTSVSISDNIKG